MQDTFLEPLDVKLDLQDLEFTNGKHNELVNSMKYSMRNAVENGEIIPQCPLY